MSGAGGGGGSVLSDRSIDPVQRDAPNQLNQWATDLREPTDVQGGLGTLAAASTEAATDAARTTTALNDGLPGLLLVPSARIGGGPQQAADGYGHQSGSPTDPLSAANPLPPAGRALGGQSPDTDDFHPALAQAPLSPQMTAALETAGYSRSSIGQGAVATTNTGSQPASTPSAPAAAVLAATASFGQAALPGSGVRCLPARLQSSRLPYRRPCRAVESCPVRRRRFWRPARWRPRNKRRPQRHSGRGKPRSRPRSLPRPTPRRPHRCLSGHKPR
jgi:hypothetical protein